MKSSVLKTKYVVSSLTTISYSLLNSLTVNPNFSAVLLSTALKEFVKEPTASVLTFISCEYFVPLET